MRHAKSWLNKRRIPIAKYYKFDNAIPTKYSLVRKWIICWFRFGIQIIYTVIRAIGYAFIVLSSKRRKNLFCQRSTPVIANTPRFARSICNYGCGVRPRLRLDERHCQARFSLRGRSSAISLRETVKNAQGCSPPLCDFALYLFGYWTTYRNPNPTVRTTAGVLL